MTSQDRRLPVLATGRGRAGSRQKTAAFFGGVVPVSPDEERLAEDVGTALAGAGFALLHGGYNGLMEAVARGPRPRAAGSPR